MPMAGHDAGICPTSGVIGNVIQHNYHTKKDVAEAIKARGGDIAIRGKMLGRPGSWAISWAVGKTTTNRAASNVKVVTEKQKAEKQKLFKRFRDAADRGFAPAFTALGMLYSLGEGVEEDQKESVKWYRKASKKGDSLAQYLLGEQYLKGRGVEKSEIEANKWWQKAAEKGEAQAQASLALAFYEGSGVLEDHVAAYVWFNLAAANDLEVAKKFKTVLSSKMEAAEIADAQNLSRELLYQIKTKKEGKPKKANSPFGAPRIDSRTGLPVIGDFK